MKQLCLDAINLLLLIHKKELITIQELEQISGYEPLLNDLGRANFIQWKGESWTEDVYSDSDYLSGIGCQSHSITIGYAITNEGKAFVENYLQELDDKKFNKQSIEESLSVSKDANNLSKAANAISKKANLLSKISIGISTLALVVSIIISFLK